MIQIHCLYLKQTTQEANKTKNETEQLPLNQHDGNTRIARKTMFSKTRNTTTTATTTTTKSNIREHAKNIANTKTERQKYEHANNRKKKGQKPKMKTTWGFLKGMLGNFV